MKYTPFEKFELQTKLSEQEILNRLQQHTEPKKMFRNALFMSKDAKYFEGTFAANTFQLRRIIRYKNSFLPCITGTIEKDFQGYYVKIKMELHKVVKYFIIVWLGFAAFITISLFPKLQESSAFLPIVPFLVIVAAYAISLGGFKYESNKAKKYLTQLLEAEETSS